MKTQIGKYIVKENTKRMDKLIKERVRLAKCLEEIQWTNPYDAPFHLMEFRDVLDRSRVNVLEWNALQAEIDDIISIETYLTEEESNVDEDI